MNSLLDANLDDFAERISRIRSDLREANQLEMSRAVSDGEKAASLKSMSYILLAAAFESLVKNHIRVAVTETQSTPVAKDKIRPSLLSLACQPNFASYIDGKPSDRAKKAVEILESTFSPEHLTIPPTLSPLDGRTLRSHHMETLWIVFGFSGPHLPTPTHKMSMEDIAIGRNEVAHGNTDPILFGRKKVALDIERKVDDYEDLAMHLTSAIDSYLSDRAYLR